MMRRVLSTMALITSAAATASAQVGYLPSKSPYRDLEKSQEITIITGQINATVDPANVAPVSGPFVGVRYSWLMGGPANFTAEVARLGTTRRVLDPLKNSTCAGALPPDCKLIDTYRWPLYFVSVGTSINLTGARTFYGFVPDVYGGLGFVKDFHTMPDVGDFELGTRFMLSYGTSLRWVPGGRYQLRLDFGDRLYSVKYPESYFIKAPDGSYIRPPVCPSGVTSLEDPRCRPAKRSAWIHNGVLTLGISYLFGGF